MHADVQIGSGGGPGREAIPGEDDVARIRHWAPLYRSSYTNTLLTARLDDGRSLALVAGRHAQHYPFCHSRSKWDDLLLNVGDESYLVSGRHLSALDLELGPGQTALLVFHGPVSEVRGRTCEIDLYINLFARVFAARPQGIGPHFALIGLLWQPALVAGTGTITIDGRRNTIQHVVGEMERGSLINFRGGLFEFGYDYLAVTRPAEAANALVEFRTSALHPGLAGAGARMALRYNPSAESITLRGDHAQEGDRLDLRPFDGESIAVLVENRVLLGPAAITRELLRIGNGTNVRYALREHFDRT